MPFSHQKVIHTVRIIKTKWKRKQEKHSDFLIYVKGVGVADTKTIPFFMTKLKLEVNCHNKYTACATSTPLKCNGDLQHNF